MSCAVSYIEIGASEVAEGGLGFAVLVEHNERVSAVLVLENLC